MPADRIDGPLQYSVLDRLLLGEDDQLQPGETEIQRLRNFVLRDLHWLLNTRQTLQRTLDGYPNLQASVLAYGFADLTALGSYSPQVRTRLMSQIEETLDAFEPRLTNVRVSAPALVRDLRHLLQFVITGTLRADPLPMQFALDTVIDKLRGAIDVSDDSGAA